MLSMEGSGSKMGFYWALPGFLTRDALCFLCVRSRYGVNQKQIFDASY